MIQEIWVKQFVKIRMGKLLGSMEVVYFRNEMTFEFYWKWKWYFQYRAALLKVKNPRFEVEYTTGSYPYTPPLVEKKKRLKDRITAKKAKITQINNEFEKVKKNWVSIFPIEQDERYDSTIKAIQKHKTELMLMENEYKELTNGN